MLKNHPTLHIVVACSRNGAIGNLGTIPWKCSSDLKHFMRLTQSGVRPTVIMGRITAQSLKKALPNRRNIVITSRDYAPHCNMEVAKTFDEAIDMARESTVYVCGGLGVYREAFKYQNLELHISRINIDVPEADVYFPSQWGNHYWNLKSSVEFPETLDEPNWTYNHYVSYTPNV